MAIAEAGKAIGIFARTSARAETKPVKTEFSVDPIPELTSDDILKLAAGYTSNWTEVRKIDTNRMTDLEAWKLGTAEIQRIALGMLGQNHLLAQGKFQSSESGFDPIVQFIEQVRQPTPADIQQLAERYKKASRFAEDSKLYDRKWKPGGITPVEERVRANLEELTRILTHFGQAKLLRRIDGRAVGPDQINWQEMRSTGQGELQ